MTATNGFAAAIETNFRDVVASIEPRRVSAAETVRGFAVSILALVPCGLASFALFATL